MKICLPKYILFLSIKINLYKNLLFDRSGCRFLAPLPYSSLLFYACISGASTGRIYVKFWNRVFLRKFINKFQIWLKSGTSHEDLKAVPLQAWSGPEGSRKLRFPDFMTTAQDGGKVVSLRHRPPLPPGNTPGTHFC